MKQKKIGDILYVYSTTAYEITEDTDASIIKIQLEAMDAFAALNESLVSKFEPINYKLFCVVKPEWADYMNDYTVTIDTITGGTVTASPTSGDEGEEITLTQEASTGYEFVSWDVKDEEGDPIIVTDNKFLMPASNVTVGASFDKIDFDITVDSTIQNGSLSAPETANLGDTVTITATPASGYKLDTLTVMCGSLEITVVNSQFTMPAGDVTITGTFVQDAVPYDEQYFTIESLADNNTITITLDDDNPDYTSRNPFSVSRDNGATWTTIVFDQGDCEYSGTLNEGDKLLIKSTNTTFSINTDDSMITSSGNFKVYGNIMSLLYGDNFANQTSFPADSSQNFRQLFYYCINLTDASNLILPATTLTSECYESMFSSCTSLTAAPVLPAYASAPECYWGMFKGCTLLDEVTMLLENIPTTSGSSAPDSLYNWLDGCSNTGTIYVSPRLTNDQKTAVSYSLPGGAETLWTIQDYVPAS